MSQNPCSNITDYSSALNCLEYLLKRIIFDRAKLKTKRWVAAAKILSKFNPQMPNLVLHEILGNTVVTADYNQLADVTSLKIEDILDPVLIISAWLGDLSIPNFDAVISAIKAYGALTYDIQRLTVTATCDESPCRCQGNICSCENGVSVAIHPAADVVNEMRFVLDRAYSKGVDGRQCSFILMLETIISVGGQFDYALYANGACSRFIYGGRVFAATDGVLLIGREGARDVTWWFTEGWHTAVGLCRGANDCAQLDQMLQQKCATYQP